MKIMKRMMGLAAAILTLSACSESEDLLSAFHSAPNAVRITAEVGKASADGFTRSNPLGATEADQKKFNDGDMISVKADGQDAVTYQLNNNEWQPQGSKFLKWESETMNFTAYYPATFDGNLNNITLPKEYDEASLAANDFMSYSGKQSNTKGNQLSLIMERMMARVVVEIDGFNDQYAGATVNSLSICGIKAYKHSDGKFYALIKPCETQNSETFISLEVAEGESKTTTETLTGIPALAAGNSYTYKLTVGKNKISVSGITVANWTGGTITGGKTEECPTPYITFKAEEAQTFKMTTTGTYEIKGLEYSLNGGDWKTVEADGEGVTFGGANGDLRLRGTNHNGTANSSSNYSTITFTNPKVNVACTGNILTLLDWRNYNIVETNNARFCYLFKDCSVLTSAPELPATKLAYYCYYDMFSGCTSLESAPELPATKLANDCYSYMFSGCTSLTAAP
uniref:fimbrillin family protein n=1 Tax=Prevotella sp. TaxID=59823 RepID=UPI003FEDC50C